MDRKETITKMRHSDFEYTIIYGFNKDLTLIEAKIYKSGVEQKVKVPSIPTDKTKDFGK
jgi:hypothetical protein